jgi:Protein kinase domain
VIAKIIDLGLAKAVNEPGSQTAISIPGGFAGTPEFASPEQFAGVGVDIRSDLYSLGVTLWEMVTSKTPFCGSPAEVMYQHQHKPLPLEQLKFVAQPVVVLLEALLKKDPARRFQSPDELLKAMPTITLAIEAGRRITRQSFQKIPPPESAVRTRRRQARSGPKKISVARLPVTGSDVFGREEDIAFLEGAWANQHVNVVTIVAWAGVGKSGPFTDRAAVGALRQQMNFLTPLSLGLEIQIHGSERGGRRAKDWRNSLHIVEPYWFWTAWSRSKIRLVHEKDGYASLPCRRSCVNSLPSIRGFA